MTSVPGVQIHTDTSGELTHIQIDVRQHREAIPALQKLGLLQLEAEDDTFSDQEEGHSIEESKVHVYSVIRQFYESNHQ